MYVGDLHIIEGNRPLVVTLFVFTTLAVVSVILRLITRVHLVKNVGADDIIILVAALGSIGYMTGVLVQMRYGLGEALNTAQLPKFLQARLIILMLYTFTHLAFKFAILFQYKRIFIERRAQRLLLGLIIWLALYGTFCFLSTILSCQPIQKFWDRDAPGSCLNVFVLHYVFAAINIVHDIILLVLPIPFLRNLQIARKVKYVLIGVFACGGFACIVAVIRLHALITNNSAPIERQQATAGGIALWTGLEINIAIICACVPALKPLFIKLFPRVSISSAETRNQPRSIRLQSFDNLTNQDRRHTHQEPGIGIKVQQSFEARSFQAGEADADSEKNLVTGSTSSTWCAAAREKNEK